MVQHLHLRANSIQQSAAMALGRLANYSDDLAEAVVQNEILPQLVSHRRIKDVQHQLSCIVKGQEVIELALMSFSAQAHLDSICLGPL